MNYEIPARTTTPILGKTIYFIGQAPTGEINNPVLISSPSDAINIFGAAEFSPLTKVYTQYYNSGGIEANLVRIGGTTSNAFIKAKFNGIDTNAIELVAVSGASNSNSYKINVYTNAIDIVLPELPTNLYLYPNYSSIEELARDINLTLGTYIKAFILEPDADVTSLENSNEAEIAFEGYTDGLDLTKNQLYTELVKMLKSLQGRYMDIVCLANMYLDDVTPIYYEGIPEYGNTYYVADRDYLDMYNYDGTKVGYHKIMIEFCRAQAELGIDTHCIMGMNKLDQLPDSGYNFGDMILKATAVGTGDGIKEYRPDTILDYGRHLSVVMGDMTYTDTLNYTFTDNWAPTYAAKWIASNFNDSLTNEIITGATVDKYFPDEVVQKMTELGVITYKFSPLSGLVIAAGITQAYSNTPWYLASNIKIVQRCLSLLYMDIYEYLSNPIEPVLTNNTLASIINTSLNKRKDEDNIIVNFDYNITYDRQKDLTRIDVELYTIYSLEKIIATTNVQI